MPPDSPPGDWPYRVALGLAVVLGIGTLLSGHAPTLRWFLGIALVVNLIWLLLAAIRARGHRGQAPRPRD